MTTLSLKNMKKQVDRGVGTRMTSSDRVRPAAGWDWLSNENEGLESSVCGVVWLTMKSSHRKRTNCRHNNYSRDQALCGLVVCSRITNRSWPLSLLLTLLTPAAFLLFPGTRVRGSTTNVEIYRPIRSLSRCWLFWDFDCSMLDGWVLIVVGFSGGEWLYRLLKFFLMSLTVFRSICSDRLYILPMEYPRDGNISELDELRWRINFGLNNRRDLWNFC